MQQALALAKQGWATVSPNPLVGCVVLSDKGDIIGQGYHHAAGQPHAEVNALANAVAQGHSTQGATVVVTLEPCNHTGRTPPCTQALIAAGVRHVEVACLDANPQVAGQGVAALRQAGITVNVGLLQAEALTLNLPFFWAKTHQQPWVSLKVASTLNGKLATRNGHSQWITDPTARHWVHHQRSRADALLTTAATALADTCQLTPRGLDHPIKPRYPRWVLDSRLRLLRHAQISLQTGQALHPLLAQQETAPTTLLYNPRNQPTPQQLALANQLGINLHPLAQHASGHADVSALKAWAWAQGITHVWVEAGPQLVASWLAQPNAVQQLWWQVAPKLLLDDAAQGVGLPAAAGVSPPWTMGEAHTWHMANCTQIGQAATLELWSPEVLATYQNCLAFKGELA
jgi:diaminohydroxyphosphoribosylaminopyrimidine deaminase/5-amino-6-(5-phosphoribosylamino)uracil reductase